MNVWKYAEWWGAPPRESKVSLEEGGTPLIPSVRIGPELGLKRLFFKYEGANPTGSYKDRFATAAVSHLRHAGKKLCLGTSSGNTGAAVAAYCARARIPCFLAIVEGAPEGKLRQMLAYGAHLYRLKDFGRYPQVSADVMAGLRRLSQELGAGLEISAFACSPLGMAGVQTLGFEIAESFPGGRVHVFTPAGGGGLTLAVARGFEIIAARGGWKGRASVHCVQPAGNDTMATPLRDGLAKAHAVESRTSISGLQVGSVLDGDLVIDICRRSGGNGYAVADERTWEWQARMIRDEGIFTEPAGAVALAGLAEAVQRREIPPEDNVVCLVTGSGFKDERSILKLTDSGMTPALDNFGAFEAKVRAALP